MKTLTKQQLAGIRLAKIARQDYLDGKCDHATFTYWLRLARRAIS